MVYSDRAAVGGAGIGGRRLLSPLPAAGDGVIKSRQSFKGEEIVSWAKRA